MSPRTEKMLDEAVGSLSQHLGENLFSCCLYGSAVRGNFVENFSDLNLLLVLNRSEVDAHEQIAQALRHYPAIDPFILGRRGFVRTVRAFAPKFASIRRNYRLLVGTDPFARLAIDPAEQKFLCEQAIRNLRLRLVYAYVTRSRTRSYQAFVRRNVPSLFVNLSDTLRLNGVSLPASFEERIPLLEREFKIPSETLRRLVEFRRNPRSWSEAECEQWHKDLFPLVDSVLIWIETNWSEL